MQMSACTLSVNDAHASVQGSTSQPSGMIIEVPEPRKQYHGCGLCVWYALQWPGVVIAFLRENLWRKICAHWGLCTP